MNHCFQAIKKETFKLELNVKYSMIPFFLRRPNLEGVIFSFAFCNT